jgi:hypothetical protein
MRPAPPRRRSIRTGECTAGELREVCPPRQFDPLPDVFYRSNGDGTFRDATADVGLEPDGKGQCAASVWGTPRP